MIDEIRAKRHLLLEQYAQINATLSDLGKQQASLQQRATLALEDLINATTQQRQMEQINEAPAE